MIAITPVQQPASSLDSFLTASHRGTASPAQPGSTMAAQPNDESADMKVLRQRLKLDARTKPGTLAAAAALAGDRSLVASKVFEAHKVPAGSQGRAKELAARIVRESLLDPDAEPSNVWLPTESLLVTGTWMKANAPGVPEFTTEPLVVSPDGKHARRVVRARLLDCGEVQIDEIDYDLTLGEHETVKNRNDKHRLREEACIRRLEGTAAAHRGKKATAVRDRRAAEADVRSVLNYTIFRLEKRLERELVEQQEAAIGLLPVWRCPGGCASPGA